MALSLRARRRLTTVLWIALAGAVIGFAVGSIRTLLGASASPWRGVVTATCISAVSGAAEVLVLADRARRLPFLTGVLIKTVAQGVLIALTFLAVSLPWAEPDQVLDPRMFGMVLAISTAMFFGGTFLQSVNRLLGSRVLRSFVTGRYHHPVEETRVFMFLDLVSSTTIAERIGHLRFHRLLRDFFFDITEPILECRGEIYKYVGDEVIVVWTLEDATRDAACVRCVSGMAEAIAGRAAEYEREFGCVPAFRVGLHVGTAVVGEIGDDRRELAFLGDVVNTSARIQGECKALGRTLLLSGDLLSRLTLPSWAVAERMGSVTLRGKNRQVELHAVSGGALGTAPTSPPVSAAS